MIRRNIVITCVAVLVSVVLCTLGFKPTQTPIENIAVVWPGAILHSVGGILFGGWGVVATLLSGTMANIINSGKPMIILGFLIPNFLQSFIPAYWYRTIVKKGWSAEVFRFRHFVLFAVLLPNTIGAFTGTIVLQMGVASDLPFWLPFVRWLIANIPISLILGYPLLRCLGPTLAEEGFVVTRWWR